MFFSIAPQTVVIPGGPTLCFQVNPDNTALVEIALVGKNADGVDGTHLITFNRNGVQASSVFTPEAKPDKDTDISQFKSVDDDAVRGNPNKVGASSEPKPPVTPPTTPPAPKPAEPKPPAAAPGVTSTSSLAGPSPV